MKITSDNIISILYSTAFIFLGVWGIYVEAPEAWTLLTAPVSGYSIEDIQKEKRKIEVNVNGVFGSEYLTEETKGQAGNPSEIRNYYYVFTDENLKTGIYVYSSLETEEFRKKYGNRPVSLRGIWEEMPEGVQLQVNMIDANSKSEDFSERDIRSLEELKDMPRSRPAISTDHRLAVDDIWCYKIKKLGMIALFTLMTLFGAAMLPYGSKAAR